MAVDLGMDDRQREGLVSFLRRLLTDLEAGKTVRVALDLQTLIDQLEDHKRDRKHQVAQGPGEASRARSSGTTSRIGSGMVAESVWV